MNNPTNVSFTKELTKATRYLGLKFSIVSSFIILLSVLGVGHYHYQNYLDNFINTHKENFSYWLQVGDIFQMERALDDFKKLEGIQVKVLNNDHKVLYHIGSKSVFHLSKKQSLHDQSGSIELGSIIIQKKIDIIQIIIIFFVAMMFNFLLCYLTFKQLSKVGKRFSIPIEKLTYELQSDPSVENLNNLDTENEKYSEIKYLKNNLKSLAKTIIKNQNDHIEYEKAQEAKKVAKQVAHDIRSPLSALDMLVKDIEDIPENKRLLIRNSVNRIHDIANDLLRKNESRPRETKIKKYLISALLESIISEKRVLIRDKSNISIEADFDAKAYGLFANINSIEFKRSISNLINNAVEAFDKEIGNIEISLSSKDERNFEIHIKDNGKGIPADKLTKLGFEGNTFGKDNGTGLGLYHTKKVFNSWGGQFDIQSTLNVGTTVILTLPKAIAPKSFVKELHITDETQIAILDDDKTIHNIWDSRIDSLNLKSKMYHFYSPSDFKEWIKNKKAQLYLIDFEYIGHKENGLDVIESLGLKHETYLVTSRYDEESIIERCEQNNVGLIPKAMAGFVPINSNQTIISPEKKISNILIDDDNLMHMAWKMEAQKNNLEFHSYLTIDEFLNDSYQFNEDSFIYIDSNLSDGVKGEIESKHIYNKGFHNLYLATGYSSTDIDKPYWIQKVVSKRPTFLSP